mgnify:CR=1 FL=1
MTAPLLRNSLKLSTAAFITAAVALWTERIEFVWYPLVAVVVVTDDSDDQTLKAATSRVLGTAMGGLITFVVHTIVQGWPGVLLSLLLMIPVLRYFGWSGGLATGGLLSVMFLMIPSYTRLDWAYVFNRGLDTVVGCIIAILVGLLFWPWGAYQELRAADRDLRQRLAAQLQCYCHWLDGQGQRPAPLLVAPLSSALQRIEQIVAKERAGARSGKLHRSGWPRRLLLWQHTHFHWIAWELMLSELPDGVVQQAPLIHSSIQAMHQELQQGQGAAPPASMGQWRTMAMQRNLPVLATLAIAQEQQPLHGSVRALARSLPC